MRKRYCLHGHDCWVTGRTKQGHCKACNAKSRKQRYHERRREKRDKVISDERFGRQSQGVQAWSSSYPGEDRNPVPYVSLDPCLASRIEPSPTWQILDARLEPVGMSAWLAFYAWIATADGRSEPWKPKDEVEAIRWRVPEGARISHLTRQVVLAAMDVRIVPDSPGVHSCGHAIEAHGDTGCALCGCRDDLGRAIYHFARMEAIP